MAATAPLQVAGYPMGVRPFAATAVGSLTRPDGHARSGWCGRPRHGVGDGFVVVAEDEPAPSAVAMAGPDARREEEPLTGWAW